MECGCLVEVKTTTSPPIKFIYKCHAHYNPKEYYTTYICYVEDDKEISSGFVFRSFENACEHLARAVKEYCFDSNVDFVPPSPVELKNNPTYFNFDIQYYHLKENGCRFMISKLKLAD